MNYFNTIKINKSNLLYNLKIVKDKAQNKKICAMVKANAYGHNLKEIVLLLKNNVEFFGVANTEEAFLVRSLTYKTKVLLCGEFNEDKLISLIRNNISLTVFSYLNLRKIIKVSKQNNLRANVHIKINTGMNRLGVKTKKSLKSILFLIEKNKEFVSLEGIYSHLYNAEDENLSFKQYLKFINFLKEVKNLNCINIHFENSCGLFNNIDKFNICNMVRVGISLYGLGLEKENLKPVLSLNSKIIATQKINDEEEYCGYGKNVVVKNTKIGVVPIGYADGILRSYKNSFVYVLNAPCKIINVCMDMMLIDITNVKANVGENCEIISCNNKKLNSVNNIAKNLNTISYEVVTNLNHNRYNVVVE